MKISGESLADPIRGVIQYESRQLAAKGVVPHLVIFTLGDESSWEVYVKRKLKWATILGIKATLKNLQSANEQEVLEEIKQSNADPSVHGIIVQRPLPANIDKHAVIRQILPEKDVDGFRPDSPFEVPVWLAVKLILSHISVEYEDSLSSFLKSSKVTVIGKGETAGTPIAEGIKMSGGNPSIIDSKTSDAHSVLSDSDIVVSCVGKKVVELESMHKGQILIGVGTHIENGKLSGDFDEEQAEQSGTIYTPTPGGIGPLNLTFLFQNVLQAAQFANQNTN
ncbi:MAG TPA: bifunctional 5,10-methylenetetrahydrofolate dehydrogenase/5,10-methenyltetrahydrofolate cyclohydrolase [Candidatus Levybacteria bacterium]|nr:bifunctional 5,10-methylenetetrahydrofolate dehydrogenase/5,10-methenyltetrahydrofolate cyclohydrolase [Candidatus Levybacteria bacterium]